MLSPTFNDALVYPIIGFRSRKNIFSNGIENIGPAWELIRFHHLSVVLFFILYWLLKKEADIPKFSLKLYPSIKLPVPPVLTEPSFELPEKSSSKSPEADPRAE
jgi:hypothetical protein